MEQENRQSRCLAALRKIDKDLDRTELNLEKQVRMSYWALYIYYYNYIKFPDRRGEETDLGGAPPFFAVGQSSPSSDGGAHQEAEGAGEEAGEAGQGVRGAGGPQVANFLLHIFAYYLSLFLVGK